MVDSVAINEFLCITYSEFNMCCSKTISNLFNKHFQNKETERRKIHA